ncbi:hypothetical protein [Streptomyces sp. NPDC055085]
MDSNDMLYFQAAILDDLEQTRIDNAGRLRQLTRNQADSDGEQRGFGLDNTNPDVARLTAIVDTLAQLEADAVKNLQRTMKLHPLGPWIKAQKGVGEKQAARLLAAVGDPYWNTLHDRPRTVSELWAYCGYHTLPMPGGHNIAAARRKGLQSNWSTEAKMRAFLIAESVVKSGGPWREVYDKRKAATEGRTHAVDCRRCGPSGKPALPGSDWSKGHRHADALRCTAKAILKGLWQEARRLHDET